MKWWGTWEIDATHAYQKILTTIWKAGFGCGNPSPISPLIPIVYTWRFSCTYGSLNLMSSSVTGYSSLKVMGLCGYGNLNNTPD